MLGVVLSVIAFIGWGFIGVMSFEHYVSGISNRFRFRSVLYIAIFTMMDLGISLHIRYFGEHVEHLESLMWGLFVVCEITFYHFTVKGTRFSRAVNTIISTVFLIAMAASIYNSTPLLEKLIGGILVINCAYNKNDVIRIYGTATFFTYAVLSATYVGEDLSNAVLSTIYTGLFWLTIYKLYKEEKVAEALENKLIEEIEEGLLK